MYLKRKVGNDVALRRVTADIRFMEPSVFSRTKKSKNMSVDPGIESKDLPFVETQAYRESYIAAKEKKFLHRVTWPGKTTRAARQRRLL